MERISIDKVISNARTGRAISPVGIRSAALKLLSTPIDKLVKPVRDDCGPEWKDEFCGFAHLSNPGKPYIEAVRHINSQLDSGFPRLTSDLFLFMSGLGYLANDPIKPWLAMCAEDALKEAGMDKEFELWLAADAREWEKENGRVPSIRNILIETFDGFGDMGKEKMDISCDDLTDELAEKVSLDEYSEPFSRTDHMLGLSYSKEEIRQDFATYYTRLFCKWMLLIMVEAPYRIYLRELSPSVA
ncbi:MAG: hypothetical protein J5829_03630 [Lachnospiraceae bacterium]|nr:hypothetical protein [Lachnospiraceae bacterium]